MQQNASNCVLPAAPSPPPSHDPAVGVNRSKFNFFKKWSCCKTNSIEARMKQHGSNYFVHTPLLPTQIHTHHVREVGSKGQN